MPPITDYCMRCGGAPTVTVYAITGQWGTYDPMNPDVVAAVQEGMARGQRPCWSHVAICEPCKTRWLMLRDDPYGPPPEGATVWEFHELDKYALIEPLRPGQDR